MIDITFDEIGEHIDNGDLREWIHGLKTLNAVKGLISDEEFERMLADMRGKTMNELTTLIEPVDTIDEFGKWIPCSERLPDEGETVLVCFSHGHREMWDISRVIEFGRISSDREDAKGTGWEWLNESSCDYWEPVWDNQVAQVIAWMPIPQPYKEKNDE